MQNPSFYCDFAATTPVDSRVLTEINRVSTPQFSNPSSVHRSGIAAKAELEKARKNIKQYCGASNANIIFTSGGTESDNLGIFGLAHAHRKNGNHIIISNIEHPAISTPCEQLKKQGFDITTVPVCSNGIVSLETLQNALQPNTILVSIMAVNNELGTIQPIREIAELTKSKDILYHVDAVQGFGKITIDFTEMGFDAMSISSHKIYGPKGVGALILRKDIPLKPLFFGGKQEYSLRTGTENLHGIVSGLGGIF